MELGGDQRQAEIIFLGTGTSEGVPRVSCLTNPLNKCEVLDIIQPNHVVIIDYEYDMTLWNWIIGVYWFWYDVFYRCVQKLPNREIRIGDLTQAFSFVTPILQEHRIFL